MATTAERITPQEAHDHMKAEPPAMLVCAYDTEEEFQQNHLEGALRLKNFASRAGAIPKDQEIIFYCAWHDEVTSAGQAEAYEAKGFTNTKALAGGVDAWKKAGYGVEE